MPTCHALAGVDNFRDFGGAVSRFGGRVRTGRLFRSANLAGADKADIVQLDRLGVRTIVDLRRPAERRRQPSRWTSFPGRLILSDLGDREEGPHIAFLRQGDLSDAGVEAYLSGYYREAFFEPRHMALFAETFSALDAGDGALLIHCTAGKDRTGLLAALIQAALGVGRPEIMADFLATNTAMMTGPRREQVSATLAPILGGEPSAAILQGFMGVTGGHLDVALASLDIRTGGLEPYLASLGVGQDRLSRLCARLLA
ncbi:tyrosine-protein phosphatase [Caulobacter sp. S45]|uniref:tyrosine-protein phosphatase n=1 Tax=Caulobacter sp. S45 TaxID=1641861 RepID=UPI00157723E6|nr:tyrosine-protein phosphatase [Caulobacter sp. S45]